MSILYSAKIHIWDFNQYEKNSVRYNTKYCVSTTKSIRSPERVYTSSLASHGLKIKCFPCPKMYLVWWESISSKTKFPAEVDQSCFLHFSLLARKAKWRHSTCFDEKSSLRCHPTERSTVPYAQWIIVTRHMSFSSGRTIISHGLSLNYRGFATRPIIDVDCSRSSGIQNDPSP